MLWYNGSGIFAIAFGYGLPNNNYASASIEAFAFAGNGTYDGQPCHIWVAAPYYHNVGFYQTPTWVWRQEVPAWFTPWLKFVNITNQPLPPWWGSSL